MSALIPVTEPSFRTEPRRRTEPSSRSRAEPSSRDAPGASRSRVEVGRTTRSSAIDIVRALCVLVVVTLHALMVGVERTADGGLVTRVALAGTEWFAPASWFIQVMPLFFIVGGFASARSWRLMCARGRSSGSSGPSGSAGSAGSSAEFVRPRVKRLALPAAAMIAVVGIVLGGAHGLGADPLLLAEARSRIAQPLWFLAVYIGVTALVPVMMRLHEWRPAVTLGLLGLGVVAVDAVRITADAHSVGFANLVFVWLLMQQLGFVQSDGAVESWARERVGLPLGRRPLRGGIPRGLVVSGLVLALLLVVVATGPYSADMLVNLNPPTAALALLGVAQFFALCVLRQWLDRRLERGEDAVRGGRDESTLARTLVRAGSFVSARSMSLYLWHMPVVLALAAVLWAGGLPLPAPHSGLWWVTRVPWLLAVALLLALALGWMHTLTRSLTLVREFASIRLLALTRGPRGAFTVQAGAQPSPPMKRTAMPPVMTPGMTALVVLSAIAGVLVALLRPGDPLPAALVSCVLLTPCAWPVALRARPGRRRRGGAAVIGAEGSERPA